MREEDKTFLGVLDTVSLFDRSLFGPSVLISGAEKEYRRLYAMEAARTGKTVLFVFSGEYEAKNAWQSLSRYDGSKAYYYPREPMYFTRADSYSREASILRARALNAVQKGDGCVICLSVWAACEKRLFSSRDVLRGRKGDSFRIDDLAERLTAAGYERADATRAPGQFSVRGGIVDFFSPDADEPVRLEFFGDDVESVRVYDPMTQTTVRTQDEFRASPFTEGMLTAPQRESALAAMRRDADERINKEKDQDLRVKLIETADEIFAALSLDGQEADRLSFLYSSEKPVSFLHLAGDCLVILNDPASLKNAWDTVNKAVSREFTLLLEGGAAFAGQREVAFTFPEFIDIVRRSDYAGLSVLDPEDEATGQFAFRKSVYAGASDLLDYKNNAPAFITYMTSLIAEGYRAVIAASDEMQMKQAHALLSGYEYTPDQKTIFLAEGYLEKGAVLAAVKTLLTPAHAFLSSAPVKREAPGKTARTQTKTSEFFSDISPGDYVVHEIYGVAAYGGVERVSLEGKSRDYFKLTYAKGDILYVGTEQLDLLSKYVGPSEAPPRINRLGTGEWSSAKAKAKSAVRELAAEYIKVYAERAFSEGYPFGQDTSWQKEFEDAFEFEATIDQIRCTEEIKADMERPVPMDRLLLGDVGFGKTEVAIRAAFKAVMEGKQVALLVPTTILALQHYKSFIRRFAGYPVSIEMMSRLRTPKEMKKSLVNIKSGISDILIGTHRILSSDIAFKDLGLLIVDEEQRFGVASKDKLKLLKRNVDTLTMSATPIPRTLHMSLSDIRDLSTIDTPPANRLPVQTYVMGWDETVVKEAIESELARNGQVFYLHNRVSSIEETTAKIRDLVPGAAVRFAHGQMPHTQLENVVTAFLEGAFDVLIATSIIENGVDFVRANTLIVENADLLGLSQLYQLRGRVGRSDVQAYAYLTYKKEKNISEDAAKRLKTIREFTKFGSGFNIAMRDLQIRGAGNILGAHQHGHFASVGYEMYARMLSDAVGEHFGLASRRKAAVEINLPADAYLPESYIPGEAERIEIYKKIAVIETEKDRMDMNRELFDRFGQPPAPVRSLLDIAWLKSLAKKAGIGIIRLTGDFLQMFQTEAGEAGGEKIMEISGKWGLKFMETGDGTRISLPHYGADSVDICTNFLKEILS